MGCGGCNLSVGGYRLLYFVQCKMALNLNNTGCQHIHSFVLSEIAGNGGHSSS